MVRVRTHSHHFHYQGDFMKKVGTFAAFFVVISCTLATATANAQSFSLSDSVINFANVELGDQGFDIVTVTNTSEFEIIVSASIQNGANGFSTDFNTFAFLSPNSSVPINVFFDPLANGPASDTLIIDVLVNDGESPSEEQGTVELTGTGGAAQDPCGLIMDIIAFYDNGIANGTLEGTHPCPSRRERAMRNRLKATKYLIKKGWFAWAAYVNESAILRSDGLGCPNDFVQGTDRQALNDQLELLQLLLE